MRDASSGAVASSSARRLMPRNIAGACDQPGDHRIRVPHFARAQLVASPHVQPNRGAAGRRAVASKGRAPPEGAQSLASNCSRFIIVCADTSCRGGSPTARNGASVLPRMTLRLRRRASARAASLTSAVGAGGFAAVASRGRRSDRRRCGGGAGGAVRAGFRGPRRSCGDHHGFSSGSPLARGRRRSETPSAR